MKRIILISLLFLTIIDCFSQNREVPFTLDDRDRLIKLEEQFNSLNTRIDAVNLRIDATNEKITSLRNEMMTKFDAQQMQINSMKNLFFWGFSILITLMLFNFGYLIWDRRTALYPLREQTFLLAEKEKEHEKKLEQLTNSFKELAKEDKKVADILKRVAIF
ncbi:MAG: hypothetical protein U9R19_06375 [Bacteroidota bacterium]|nr:hypothetical protein [Bacteroidota bacterium]